MADPLPDGMAGSLPAKTGGPDDIQTAWKILAGGSPVAAAALVHIAEHGKSEIARVQASQAVLDRVGLATPKERPSVVFSVIPQEFNEVGVGAQHLSPAEVIRDRLAALHELQGGLVPDNAAAPDWQQAQGDDTEPVDAELVPMPEEDDGDWGAANPWG